MYDDYLNDFVAGNAYEDIEAVCDDKAYEELMDADLDIFLKTNKDE